MSMRDVVALDALGSGPTARQAYAARCAEAKRLCRQIIRAVEADAREAHADPDNWGHAGHMGAVVGSLEATLATLEGKE